MAVSESRVGDVSTTLDRDVSAPSADDLLGGPPAGESGPATTDDLLAEPGGQPAEAPASDDPLAE